MNIKRDYTKYGIIYYLKFHYELNYIEYFRCNKKSQIRKNCTYNIEGLKKDILKILVQVKG